MIAELVRAVPLLGLAGYLLSKASAARHGTITDRALFSAVLFLAAGVLIDLPRVHHLAEIGGVPENVLPLATNCAVILSAASTRELLRGFALPATEAKVGLAPRLILAGSAVALLVVAFAFAPVHGRNAPPLADNPPRGAALAIYWTIYFAFLGSALVNIVVLTRSYVKQAAPSSLRTSLRLIGYGCAAGVCYLLIKAACLVEEAHGLRHAGSLRWASSYTGVVGMVLIVCGLLTPRLELLPSFQRRQLVRSLRDTYLLWRDLTALNPAVVLGGPERNLESRSAADLRWERDRRVIEIQDIELQLRVLLPPHALREATREAERRGLERSQAGTGATAQAVCLELGRRAKLRGDPVRQPSAEALGPDNAAPAVDDATWFEAVGRAYADRMSTQAIADQLETRPASRSASAD